jgi:hypothetical protein
MSLVGYGKKLREWLLRCGLANPYSLEGCSEEEIELVRQGQHVDFLPQVYREFLREVGKQAGNLFAGSTYTYWAALTLKDETNYELEKFERNFRIPDDAVVFLDHGGYANWYFHTRDRDDNPAVYVFYEEGEMVQKLTDHLSQFLEDAIRENSVNCQ